jgi:uncharacterized membrane protein YkvA (DUF1232 family)
MKDQRFDEELEEVIADLLARFRDGGRREDLSALRHLPHLYHVAWRAAFDFDLPSPVRHYAGSLAFYVTSGIDFIPDDGSPLGYLDDLAVVAGGLSRVVARSGAPALEPHWRGPEALLVAIRQSEVLARRLLPDGVSDRVASYLEWD